MRKPAAAPDGPALVIVESPAKSKTINQILGNTFIVRASLGHVMDLPKRSFGIDLDHDFAPTFKVLTKRKEIVKELRALAQRASTVFLATDPDREGEAISWHLVSALKLAEGRFRRVTFNEITREGVQRAFEKPGAISMDRVNAQLARRLLDRIVGYKLSPLLWDKIAKRLSAGRVQSAALKIIVDREREILAFKSVEYWEIHVTLGKGRETFQAKLHKIDGVEPLISTADQAEALVEELRGQKFAVGRVAQKDRVERPYPPFTTSLLQQRASIELGFSARRTMIVAQQLYEGINLGGEGPIGLITYMRTDSTRIAGEALRAVRSLIAREFGAPYLPSKPYFYKTRAKLAQEAHEAIRPTHVDKSPESIRAHLTSDQYKLYRLIWKRFVACQMKEAVFLTTEVDIQAGRAVLLARGREMRFDGFLRVLPSGAREDQVLPKLAAGDELALKKIEPSRHVTEPPPRYSEAGLIKALERHGIGRPSTYAPTLATIVERGYVRIETRRLVPSELGTLVTEKLERHFQTLMSLEFTARMEESLDKIEEGKTDSTSVLREFYAEFTRELDKAAVEMTAERDRVAEEKCPHCESPMSVRWTRFGKLIQCAAESCGFKMAPASAHVPGQACAVCRSPMVVKWGRRGKFLACTQYPDCTFTRSIVRGNKVVRVPEGSESACEKSGHPMAVRMSRRGAFLGCTGYPACRNARRIPGRWIVDLVPKTRAEKSPAREEIEERDED